MVVWKKVELDSPLKGIEVQNSDQCENDVPTGKELDGHYGSTK